MSEFVIPKGTNFSCVEELSAVDFSKVLLKIIHFIQQLDSYSKFERYDDWWEHDGLHFYRNSISCEDLLKIVSSPESLSEAMPGDWYVFIGIAPIDNLWYLRFYLSDEDEDDLITRFDITFPNELVQRFKSEVLSQLNLEITEQDSEIYYQTIISE